MLERRSVELAMQRQHLANASEADPELYKAWARLRLQNSREPTPYELFMRSIHELTPNFHSPIYHVDWITRIEPRDAEHEQVGLRAALTPILVSLGLDRDGYRNAFNENRYRFVQDATIMKRISLSDFRQIGEFVQFDSVQEKFVKADLMSASRVQRLSLQINLDNERHDFVRPSDADAFGHPYLPSDYYVSDSTKEARLFAHYEPDLATRILIPCSEVFRAFYGAGTTFMQKTLEGAFRRKSAMSSTHDLRFNGVRFYSSREQQKDSLSAESPLSQDAEREVGAIMARAIRANQNDGFFAIEVRPPASGMVVIEGTGIVFRSGAFKSIFITQIASVQRPHERRRSWNPFSDPNEFARAWPAPESPWQMSFSLDRPLLPPTPVTGADHDPFRCRSCGQPWRHAGSAAYYRSLRA